jgi:hypothetical protein
MSKGGSAPAPVDPYQAASAQYQYGAATANYDTQLARPNINTPYGSVDWSTGGTGGGTSSQPINIPGYGSYAYSPAVGGQPTPAGGYGYPAPSPTGGTTSTGVQPYSGGGVYRPPINRLDDTEDDGGNGGVPNDINGGGGGYQPAPAGQPLGQGDATPWQQFINAQDTGGGAGNQGNLQQNAAYAPTSSLLPGEINTGGSSVGGAGGVTGNGQTGGVSTANTDPYALTASNTLTAPSWSENVNLSPAQQQLLNLQEGTQISSGMTGQNLAGQAAENLSQPITSTPIQTSIDTAGVPGIAGANNLAGFTNEAQQAAYQQQMQYLQPEEAQQTESTNAALVNSGAQPGSAAYNNAEQLLTNQQMQENTNAQNNAVAQGLAEQQALYGESANTNQQLFGEAATTQSANNTGAQQQLAQELAVRDQPLNELQTEYGISNPAGVSALSGSMGGGAGSATAPDILDAFNQSAQQQEANYNAGVASSNATEGAVGSLASSYLMYLALS